MGDRRGVLGGRGLCRVGSGSTGLVLRYSDLWAWPGSPWLASFSVANLKHSLSLQDLMKWTFPKGFGRPNERAAASITTNAHESLFVRKFVLGHTYSLSV